MIKHIEVYARTLREANYILETRSTLRQTAKMFGVSKSVVHRDIKIILAECDKILYDQVQLILKENISLGQLRGGESTKQKHLKK